MNKTLEARALRLLTKTPLTGLDDWASKITAAERQEMAAFLDNLAIQAARFSGYLSSRGVCDPHDDSVKESNKSARKVRKALGYTIPMQDIRF